MNNIVFRLDLIAHAVNMTEQGSMGPHTSVNNDALQCTEMCYCYFLANIINFQHI